MQTRIEREKEYHNKRFEREIREPTTKYYKITNKIREHFNREVFLNCSGAKIIELGCSKGRFTIELCKKGAEVTGIDISEVAINTAKTEANNAGIDGKCNFLVKNASELDFKENSFDKVIGGAILHHLDYEKALASISNVLKKNGKGIFIEPLGFNPIINLYRKFTPKFRTVDESPLKSKEMKLLSNYFGNVEIVPYYFLTLLAVPFYKFTFFEKLVSLFDSLDQLLFKIPIFKKFAWQVIIKVSNPIKKQDS